MTSVWLQKAKLAILLLVLEVAFIVLFAITTDYEDSARPPASLLVTTGNENGTSGSGDKGHEPEAAAAEPGPIATYYASEFFSYCQTPHIHRHARTHARPPPTHTHTCTHAHTPHTHTHTPAQH